MSNSNEWAKSIYVSIGLCLLALGIGAMAKAQQGQKGKAGDAPVYKIDPFWPKQLPVTTGIMQQVGDMAVDKDNRIWVLQRLGSNDPRDYGLDEGIATCCTPAPPVLVFDVQGNFIKSWGGPGAGYDWPMRSTAFSSIKPAMCGSPAALRKTGRRSSSRMTANSFCRSGNPRQPR